MTLEEQAIKVLDESDSDSKSNLVDELVKEFPALAGSLVKTINRRNKTNLEVPKKERVSKNKILLDITSNLSKINGELIITNSRLQAQNDLLRGNLAFTASSIGNLEYNDHLLTGKLDSVLEALKIQNQFMREQEEDKERDDISNNDIEDVAFTEGFDNISKKGTGVVGKTVNLLKSLLMGAVGMKLKKMIGRRLLIPLLKKFAPGLASSLTKKGLAGTVRSILPKWLGGTGPLKAKQLDLFAQGSDVMPTRKPGMLQKAGKWLNNTSLVKSTRNVLGPRIKPIRNAITNFSKDPMKGIQKYFSGKGKSEIAEVVTEKATRQVGKKLAQKTASKGMGAIPLVGNFWDLASAAYRFGQGDVVGGFLSLGSAIPVLGWGVAAIDVARDAGAFGETGFEHGGVIQAPPILTPAEKGAVIGGNGSSDIGHIVNASAMISDMYGINLSGAPNTNDFPADGSTGNITINPLAGSQPVREDDLETEETNGKTWGYERGGVIEGPRKGKDMSNQGQGLNLGEFSSDTTSDDTSGLGVKNGDNIAFNWKKPSDNIEQLRYKSDHPLGTEQPNPFREGTTLYKNFERMRLYDKSGMTISSANNNFNVANISPVTENNNISDNISVDVDPSTKTKIVVMTRTVTSGGNVVGSSGGGIVRMEYKPGTPKLSRLMLA
tara:strand:+ start:51 stop:2042 length:1992 start_codon:yes stop_codon:yes gene_type:complete